MARFAHRPSSAPDFLLSRAHGSVRTQGSRATYSDPWEAVAALREGRVTMVVGALPFLRDDPAALTVPERIISEQGPLEPHAHYRIGPGSQLHSELVGVDPEEDEHRARVEAAVATIARTRLEKVVLARAVDVRFDPPADPLLVAAKLIDRSPHCDGFIADLSPAGGDHAHTMLVGSSPEVLVRKHGTTISAYPLAGSAPRGVDKRSDEENGQRLYNSTKDLAEHAHVVQHLERTLRPLCETLSIPERPELTKTAEMWHLATPITGTVKEAEMTALELALQTHPTPAICGTPTDAAEAIITATETPRGFYAGAVGWSNRRGDGEYMVAIRCAEVDAYGTHARTWAGGGIVADSDPQAELDETTAKLRTIMSALGL
ncbi:isochorismate synthase MenF [Corynebacterium sp. TAE3-ERU2]|uniref:isochorismate synthase n=1 Tax=Corynebacterium sp. TAE3-ERU2 TaxID=2849497 RepID=UPI001C472044|nr:isochorismate synthase [Corynebacterium sp. TAE3-ERU2]MBV7301092.1 isochorismate synthase [Corynebacterium sp. TAE3-ERU2]